MGKNKLLLLKIKINKDNLLLHFFLIFSVKKCFLFLWSSNLNVLHVWLKHKSVFEECAVQKNVFQFKKLNVQFEMKNWTYNSKNTNKRICYRQRTPDSLWTPHLFSLHNTLTYTFNVLIIYQILVKNTDKHKAALICTKNNHDPQKENN